MHCLIERSGASRRRVGQPLLPSPIRRPGRAQPRRERIDDGERPAQFCVARLGRRVLRRIAEVEGPAAPVGGGRHQIGDVGKARLRQRPELRERVRLAGPLAGKHQKALQQLFDRLLAMERAPIPARAGPLPCSWPRHGGRLRLWPAGARRPPGARWDRRLSSAAVLAASHRRRCRRYRPRPRACRQ